MRKNKNANDRASAATGKTVIPLMPSKDWKVADRISWSAAALSLISILLASTVALVQCKNQARSNDLQERLTLLEHAPDVHFTGFKVLNWFGDDEPFLSLSFKNDGNIPAKSLEVVLDTDWAPRTLKVSAQWRGVLASSSIAKGAAITIPAVAISDIRTGLEKAHPGCHFVRLIDQKILEYPDGLEQFYPDTKNALFAAHSGHFDVIETPVFLKLNYRSALGPPMDAFIVLYAVMDSTDA